jgi:hypothetical protein
VIAQEPPGETATMPQKPASGPEFVVSWGLAAMIVTEDEE